MSSELRIKKLRGSGGYIMANVSDEQQQKGNLGGPDLFLAPVGRLDNEKISKYFCNTCEKEFEGPPKIEFENPNEEVAENLVLAEKGQYVCTTCGATLAEYREFKKPNELGDVGLAKPYTTEAESSTSLSSESIPESVSNSYQSPQIESTPSFEIPSMQAPSETQTSPIDSTFSSISGMAVYDQNAKKIGIAKQVGVDSRQTLVLVITDNEGNDLTVPWNEVKKVGEIVLLGKDDTSPDSSSAQPTQNSCPNCGFANKAGSKFCEQCGTKI